MHKKWQPMDIIIMTTIDFNAQQAVSDSEPLSFMPSVPKRVSTTRDQTIKMDDGKPRLSLMPRDIIYAIVRVREYGLTKYTDPESYKKVSIDRYKDAFLRHFMSYLDDSNSIDDESGLPHLWHAAWNIATLIELEKEESK